MWFLPTYGRPQMLETLMGSPGGMPPRDKLTLILTAGDPSLPLYEDWPFERHIVPAKSLGDSLRAILPLYPTSDHYGFLTDDQVPITPGWWIELAVASMPHYIAISNTPGCSGALPGVPCFGGNLVRAMGSILPVPDINHNSGDVVWAAIGAEFDLIRVCSDVTILHNHPTNGTAPMDVTYERGAYNPDFKLADPVAYDRWAHSAERQAMNERIRALGPR